jgi:glycine/D-amino acid oxidase-like deaminating enzyme
VHASAAGVVGLACARALALAGDEVLLVDKATSFGTETSSRHSEGAYMAQCHCWAEHAISLRPAIKPIASSFPLRVRIAQ